MMLKHAGLLTTIAAVLLLASASGPVTQGLRAQGTGGTQKCTLRAAEAISSSRDTSLGLAYEAVLQSFDPRMAKTWASRGRKIGEAPGYQVRKLSTKCTLKGVNQSCQVEVTLCN